jgi:hypothetical protein
MPNFDVKSIQTPTAAKQLAAAMFAACYNDEIRAILAKELIRRIDTTMHEDAIAKAHQSAWEATSALVTAFDRQFTD